MPPRRAFAAFAALAACSLACGNQSATQPPGMTTGPASLTSDGSAAFGLAYGETRAITVRYRDQAGHALAGQAVRFQIFGDPKGSTLSSDHAATDAGGAASVMLTAGAAEAQFRVVASAPSASDLELDVSVSRHAFVELDVGLAYAGASMGSVASVEALVYDDRPCAALGPAPLSSGALRVASAPGASATLPFPYLLVVDYAVAGLALDGGGHVIGWGCVDLPSDELAHAQALMLPVPLARALPTVAGPWKLTIDVPVAADPSPVAVWDALTACQLAPASALLDGMVATLGDDPAAARITAARGPVDGSGCRPDALDGNATLDGALEALLEHNGAPAALLGDVVQDLDAIVAHAVLDSELDLSAGASGALVGTHRLQSLALSARGGGASYDLVAAGAPIVTAPVAASQEGSMLRLGAHGFTLRLPTLWGRALGDLALAPRGLPSEIASFVAALYGAAARNGLTGCAAISDLACGGAAGCDLTPPCTTAIATVGDALAAPFAATAGIDLTLAGGATVRDDDSDLIADGLTDGNFDATLGIAPTRSITPTLMWSATPIH